MKTKTTIFIIAILIVIGFAIYLTFEKEQAKANRVKIINTDIDKIVARMNRVLDEPEGFATHTKMQRDDDETRLRQIASSVNAEINDIIIEMKANGYPYEDKLKKETDWFFAVYNGKVESDKMSYEWDDLGDSKLKKEEDAMRDQAGKDAAAALSDVQSLKVDSSNLTE
jgi:gas vesicle protein